MATFSVLAQLESAKGPLDAKRVAEIFGVSAKSVYKGASSRQIPSYRLLGALRFDPKVLAFWYRKQHPMVAAADRVA